MVTKRAKPGYNHRYSESSEARTSPILSRVSASVTCSGRAKEKTFCAPREPQKVLVVERVFALPDGPDAPCLGHRVDGLTGPLMQETYSPFDCNYSTSDRTGIQTTYSNEEDPTFFHSLFRQSVKQCSKATCSAFGRYYSCDYQIVKR